MKELSMIVVIGALFTFAVLMAWAARPRSRYNHSDGKRLDYLPMKGGKPACPDCGSTELLAGPSGGANQNVACGSCFGEFNIAWIDNPPLVHQRFGKMTMGRARVYGISSEEYEAKRTQAA